MPKLDLTKDEAQILIGLVGMASVAGSRIMLDTAYRGDLINRCNEKETVILANAMTIVATRMSHAMSATQKLQDAIDE